ncbi:uncharacterized protein LY89DRAFT_89884 [Mollisia scopiformis]|uniref:Uncharacterized protein n=1 Tax=Mollisia scopiformis TaxID=149040 RepID=A0A194X628_MOLSC|nr:uncharacterized protein LY89DRAFT_89884 [Mollisia scopiformis]KUJ15633.1 hypothetical protein LY89DRAFT_89884 [Mollisia scopiformis]
MGLYLSFFSLIFHSILLQLIAYFICLLVHWDGCFNTLLVLSYKLIDLEASFRSTVISQQYTNSGATCDASIIPQTLHSDPALFDQ